MKALLGGDAASLLVDLETVTRRRRTAIEQNTEPHGPRSFWRPHYEMQIPAVKTVRDSPVRLVQRNRPFLDRPIAGERPLIQSQLAWHGVRSATARCDTPRR